MRTSLGFLGFFEDLFRVWGSLRTSLGFLGFFEDLFRVWGSLRTSLGFWGFLEDLFRILYQTYSLKVGVLDFRMVGVLESINKG